MMVLLIGAGMIVATTTVHALSTALAIYLHKFWRKKRPHFGFSEAVLAISSLVILMFVASAVETMIWAVFFVIDGGFDPAEPFETIVYFSIVTYTTLGYGDIVLDPPHRMFAAICSVNGIIMFGWTTALVFAFVHWVNDQRPHQHGDKA